MLSELIVREYTQLLADADRDFREDVSYAVAIAKAGRTIRSKRDLWEDRRAAVGLDSSADGV
jgi:hypothetical protein